MRRKLSLTDRLWFKDKKVVIVLTLACAGMLATFLPWFNTPPPTIISCVVGKHSVNTILMHYNGTECGSTLGIQDGWITFFLFALTISIALLNCQKIFFKGSLLVCIIIPALISAGIGLRRICIISDDIAFGKLYMHANHNFSNTASIGFGLYSLVIVGFVLPVFAFYLNSKALHQILDTEEELL